MEKPSYVYILASAPYGTLYIGKTNDLVRRVWEHREGVYEGFTKTYSVRKLVWFETYSSHIEAAMREKRIKHWKRAWKVDLISKGNPRWLDLYLDFCG